MPEKKKARVGGRPMAANDKRDELEIVVQNASSCEGIPRAESLKRWVRHALGGDRSVALTVRVVDEPEGADLNERYRHGQGATNVLAFPAEAPDLPPTDELPLLGDLVICAPVLEREAAAQGKSLDAHWAHIAIHGALHLVGFAHDVATDAEAMEAREIELLAALGFGDPYADDG